MGKTVEANLDAYRLVAESLVCLRAMVRSELVAAHGGSWVEAGIPDDVRSFLVDRQSREAAINWLSPDSTDLLDFAGFSDLDGVIAATPALQSALAPLAPPAIMHARLLELQTMLNRVAYVRPIAESEMTLLATFFERVRRLTQHLKATERQAMPAQAAPAPPPAAPAPEPPPPQPPAAPAAVDESDDHQVLEALYREVTTLADGLWSQGAPGWSPVWEHLQVSGWVDGAAGRMDLQPVREFYSLHDQARARLEAGTSKAELHEFLKQASFAQVLLSLREVFSRQMTAERNR